METMSETKKMNIHEPEGEEREVVISTRDLTKVYHGRTVVDHVSITIRKGDIYGLIGKNGAGKTTLMRMILTLAHPTSGTVSILGRASGRSALSHVGALIEAPALYDHCTAEENLKRFCILSQADPARIPGLLQEVGLGNTGGKKAGQFSLGMKQRLGIAIALLGDPEILILDEPVNGLDPAGIKQIRDLILKLNRERGTTFLISSHLLDELARVVTGYGIINAGHLVEEVSVQELEHRCRKKLNITVSDPGIAQQLIRGQYNDVEMFAEGNRLTLHSHMDEAARINRLLVENGVDVNAIEPLSGSIEDYFMERMGHDSYAPAHRG